MMHKVFEISDYDGGSRYSHKMGMREHSKNLEEAYECGYEDGYDAAMEEMEEHYGERFGRRRFGSRTRKM